MDRIAHQDLEVVPVLRQQLEFESVWDRLDVPRFRLGLEAAHDEPADFLLVIQVAVGIANHRHVGSHAGDRLGDEVEVLGGVERHVDAGEAPERASPLAPAIDECFAGDRALVIRGSPADSGDVSRGAVDARDLDAFDDRCAPHPRTLGERLCEIGGIRLAVAGNPHGPREVVCAQDRHAAPGFGWRHELEFDAEALGARHLPLHRHEALRRPRDVEAAALFPAGGKSRLLLERRVEVDPVAAHPRRIAGGARLADEAGRVPRGAARELALLQQNDVPYAELRKVVGRGNTGDAAADDDSASLGGHFGAHRVIRVSRRPRLRPRSRRRQGAATRSLPSARRRQ